MKAELTFGDWLKRRRGGLGLTQKELAQQVGYAEVTLRKVEADELRPSRQMAEKLAEVLQIADEERIQFVRFARDEQGWDEVSHLPLTPTLPPGIATPRIPNNLPTPLTALVGRAKEVKDICDLLLRPDIRLVTMTGAGGTGKTRLAIHIARWIYDWEVAVDRQLMATFRVGDGVFFTDLAPLRDPELVVSAIAQSLDFRGQGGAPLLEVLKERLRNKQLLLVLDNFEHLVEAAPFITDLLITAPALKVIVTSRRPLHLRGEVEYSVPPLMALEPSRVASWLTLAQCEAVQLFIQRTLHVKPDFMVTAENVQAVAAICHRLDGLPLAIELSAVRMKIFPPQMLLQRLERRLPLLTGGARDLPLRQQTMQNTIEWSYDLLSAQEKILFVRLAVFVGGATHIAVEAVCDVDSVLSIDLLDSLALLVDQGLLQVEMRTPAPRFMMFQTIQEFALERLAESGESELIHRQHAHHYLIMTSEIDPKLRDAKLAAKFKQLLSEQDNFRSVLQWCLENSEPTWALQLAARLSGFWEFFGDLSEGRRWLENALSAAQPQGFDATRADALFGLGTLLLRQGNYTNASRLLHESLILWKAASDQWGIAHTLLYLGNLLSEKGDLKEAVPYFEECLELFHKLNFSTGIGVSIGNLGLVALMEGDYQKGHRFIEEALSIIREIGDPLYTGMLLGGVGWSLFFQGETERAHQSLVASIRLLADLGERWWLGYSILMLAMVAIAQQEAERATCLLGAAAALRELRHGSVAPVFQPALERTISDAKASLSAEAFSSAWQKGAMMTIEQMLMYVAADTID